MLEQDQQLYYSSPVIIGFSRWISLQATIGVEGIDSAGIGRLVFEAIDKGVSSRCSGVVLFIVAMIAADEFW